MPRIPLVGSSFKGVSAQLDSQKTMNLMVERADSKEAAAPAALIGTPGLSIMTIVGAATSAPLRAMLELPPLAGSRLNSLLIVMKVGASDIVYLITCDETEFAATGNMVYTLSAAITNQPGFDADYPPMIVASPVTAVISNIGGLIGIYYTLASGAVGTMTLDAAPTSAIPFADMTHLAGYFVAYMKSGTGAFHYIFYSANGIAWVSADFFTAEADSSEVVKLVEKNGHLWVLKSKCIQVFAPTGQANNPFAPIQSATIQKGCRSKETVRLIGNYIYFLGNSEDGSGFVVYRVAGSEAQRVSNGFVEKKLQDIFDAFGPAGINDIVASNAVERGRNLYKLHCHRGKTTMVFDELTGEWHERGFLNPSTGEYEEELGTIECSFNGKHIAGERRDGLVADATLPGFGIYEVSEQFTENNVWYTDSVAHAAGVDTIIRRERISPQFSDPDGRLLTCSELELLFENGFANSNGQGSDPKVTLYISHDGGNTWGNGITRSIGMIGKYKDRCVFHRLGSSHKFTFKIEMTDPIAWKLANANATFSVGE